MRGRSTSWAWAWSLGSLSLAALGSGASTIADSDLVSVLSEQSNLTTFIRLVEEHIDLYKDLPTDPGVTVSRPPLPPRRMLSPRKRDVSPLIHPQIIAPNDAAFIKGSGWDEDEESIPVWLTYGILNRTLELGQLSPGDTLTLSTLLTDSKYANVTGGQNLLATMQPGEEVILTSGTGTHVTVVGLDIPFEGGLIQIVESLPVTPRRLETSIRDSYTDLSAFLGALYAADLVDEFAETPNATIFAPHNQGFQRFAGTFEDMDKDELRRVLRYHLVPDGVLRVSDLSNNTNVKTDAEDGEEVHITRYINDIYVNTARIIQTDLLIANGIIQMIDSVLNVDEDDARPDVTRSTQPAVFTATESAATGTDAAVPFISDLPCTADCSSAVESQPTGSSDRGADSNSNSDNPAAPTGVANALGMGLAAAGAVGIGIMGIV